MPTTISFSVPGKPGAKGRPRFSLKGGTPRVYTPKKTIEWQNLVRVEFEGAVAEANFEVPTGRKVPVAIEVQAYFPIPQSKPKWWRKLSEGDALPYTGRADCDNIVKAVCDSLNDIAYADDAQVFDCHIAKRYGSIPRTEVTVIYFEAPTRETAGEPTPKKKHDQNGKFKFKEPMGITDNPYGNGADGLNH